MELKTNEDGKAIIDVIPIGDTMRLPGNCNRLPDLWPGLGKIDTDSKDITVRLKRPQQQYSTYDHPASGTTSGAPADAQKQNSTPTPPKQ